MDKIRKGRWAVLVGWCATGRILHKPINCAEKAYLRKLALDGKLGPHSLSNLKKLGIITDSELK